MMYAERSPQLTLSDWESALVDFVGIGSVTGHEREAGIFLHDLLLQKFPGAALEMTEVIDNRFNLYLRKGNPALTLTSHIDTVPGEVSARVTNDRIFGRGSCDAKGQIIAQLAGLELAISRGLNDYAAAYVIGEEVDSLGAHALIARNDRTAYILNGEPTGNRFVSRSWGVVEAQVTATGRRGHSSQTPVESAIHKLISDLDSALAANMEGISINVGAIRGGEASNVIADSASADLCIRVRDDTDFAIASVSNLLRRSSLRLLSTPLEPVTLFVPSAFEDGSCQVKFGSDCGVYSRAYERVMLFGPGSITDAHTADESIDRSELAEAAEIIARLLNSF